MIGKKEGVQVVVGSQQGAVDIQCLAKVRGYSPVRNRITTFPRAVDSHQDTADVQHPTNARVYLRVRHHIAVSWWWLDRYIVSG